MGRAERADPMGALVPYLADDVVMLLPGDLSLAGEQACLEPPGGLPPWSDHEITDARVVGITEDSGMVAYRERARHPGQDTYHALIGSTWVRRDGTWLMVRHQHTPV